MAREIKNVALTGATGNVGSHTLKALIELKKFNITILARKEGLTFPSGVAVKVVDLSSVSSLTEALQGQDAVIDTTQSSESQTPLNLIEASVAAGVYRFIPSDFGLDPANPVVASLPVFGRKQAGYKRVQEKATSTGLTWTVVSNGAFLDFNLRSKFFGIDLPNKKVTLFNDGTADGPWTTLESIGKATASVLLHPEETKNRTVFISSTWKSQLQIVELAKETLGADGWDITSRDMNKEFEQAIADLKAGKITPQVFITQVQWAATNPEAIGKLAHNDNDLLGVHAMSDDEVKELIKKIARE